MQKGEIQFAVEELGKNLGRTMTRAHYNARPPYSSSTQSLRHYEAFDSHRSRITCLLCLPRRLSSSAILFNLWLLLCCFVDGNQGAVLILDNPHSCCRSRRDPDPDLGPGSTLHLESADRVHIHQHFLAFDRTPDSA